MTETNQRLLKLVMDGKTLNQISEELNLSPKQVCRRLETFKNSGYNICYTLLDSGEIEYGVFHTVVVPAIYGTELKLVKEPNKFKAIVISDLHIGSCRDNLERINAIYEYCSKNGINIIINTGDLIDGVNSHSQRLTLSEQPEFLIEKYPYDKNILNIACFGNHDFKLLKECGLNISTLLKYSRPDFIPLGYKYGFINILNEQIVLNHSIKQWSNGSSAYIRLEEMHGKLLLQGHRHKMGIEHNNGDLRLSIPTLSDIIFDESTLPGAVRLDIDFNESGYWENIHVEHLVVTDKIYTVNEIDFVIPAHSKNNNDKITENKITYKVSKRLIR